HLLRQVRANSGGIELKLIAHRATQQLIDRLAADLGKQVPQCQIHTRYRINHHSLAAVMKGCMEHLVPHDLDVGDLLPLHESRQMLLHDESSYSCSPRHAEADRALARFHLYDQGSQYVDAERASRLAVLGVFAHWPCDLAVDPVARFLVVVIRASATHRVSANVTNYRRRHGWRSQFIMPGMGCDLCGRFANARLRPGAVRSRLRQPGC